jgi:predicted dehydrogenase
VPKIGIGIVGGGYMGKAHAVAMSSVGAIFETNLRPKLEMVCATSASSAERYRKAYGFARATSDWNELVNDPAVEAIIIASPQSTHLKVAEAAFALGKPVLCEKPMGASLAESRKMVELAESSGVTNMVAYNYIRTPASQFVRQLLKDGVIGDVTWFRGEHTEDFLADPDQPANWRTKGMANGNMGDLAPHIINAALALMGPVESLMADVETVFKQRKNETTGALEDVTNDDHAQMMVRFKSGVMGHIYSSRVAAGRKMGYAYEITGTKGAIRFDQEDQNAVWLYKMDDPNAHQGFKKILTGPEHPDYLPFCQGPGHGTGYQDQIIIEAKDFLEAIDKREAVWPTFKDGLDVAKVVATAIESAAEKKWLNVDEF